MSERTMKLGHAPDVPINEILNLRGKVCAVEFGSRKLLGYGDSWEEALRMVDATDNSDRKFYRYVVARSFRREEEILDLSKENLPSH